MIIPGPFEYFSENIRQWTFHQVARGERGYEGERAQGLACLLSLLCPLTFVPSHPCTFPPLCPFTLAPSCPFTLLLLCSLSLMYFHPCTLLPVHPPTLSPFCSPTLVYSCTFAITPPPPQPLHPPTFPPFWKYWIFGIIFSNESESQSLCKNCSWYCQKKHLLHILEMIDDNCCTVWVLDISKYI